MNSALKIKKVKVLGTDEKIKIDYTELHNESEDEISGTFPEPAAPEFYEAFKKLKIAVCNILEFSKFKGMEDRLTPYGVTFKYSKDGTMGAIISAKLSLPDAGTEVVINTPLRKCAPDDESDDLTMYFTDTTRKNLWTLEQETRKYLSGKRAQIALFGANGQPLVDDTNEENDEADELENQQNEDVPKVAGAAMMSPEAVQENVTDIKQYAAQR